MVILNFFGGIVPRGVYETIIAHGQTRIGKAVRFKKLIIRGFVELENAGAGDLCFEGGSLRCGNLSCRKITGHGNLFVEEQLNIASYLDFTGRIKAQGITCTALTVRGQIMARHITARESTTITGHITTQYLTTSNLTVSALQTTMLPRFGMESYGKPSNIGLLKANQVRMQAAKCLSIHADSVILEKKAYAQHVLYNTDLSYDKTSYVSSMKRRHPGRGDIHRTHAETSTRARKNYTDEERGKLKEA